jgi:hypothetical protein
MKMRLGTKKELERLWSSQNFSTEEIELDYCCFEQDFEEMQKVH